MTNRNTSVLHHAASGTPLLPAVPPACASNGKSGNAKEAAAVAGGRLDSIRPGAAA